MADVTLGRFGDRFSRLLTRRAGRKTPGPVTAIEVDGPMLRVVSANNRGVITRASAAPLDLPASADRSDPEVLGKAIASTLGKLRLKPGPVAMGIPRASVLLRSLVLPPLPKVDEMASMVHLQVGKDLPYRLEDAVVDFQVCGPVAAEEPPARTSAEAETPGAEAAVPITKYRVAVAVVRREVVGFYTQMARAAGLKLVHLGLAPHANARSVEACRVAEGDGAIAIVTLRPDEVGIELVGGGMLLFSRGASIKAPGLAPDEAAADPQGAPAATVVDAVSGGEITDRALETATIEVVRSLHSFGGMGASAHPVGKVVVAGNTGREDAFVTALAARLTKPVSLLNLADALRLPAEAREKGTCSLSAAGLALGANDEQGLPFDFLNPKRPAVLRDNRKVVLLLGTVAAAAVIVFILGLRTYLVNQRTKTRQAVAAELADARKKRPLYRQMKQQLATVEEWQRGGRDWLEQYAFLSAVLPPSEEIYITSFSVSGSGSIRLSVRARSGAVLAKLDKDLRAAGYEVKPLAITPADEKYGYGFNSTVELDVPAKLRIDLSKVRSPPRPADDASLEALRKGGAQ
jgi:Tfp pilus assembly PilM family ATPase